MSTRGKRTFRESVYKEAEELAQWMLSTEEADDVESHLKGFDSPAKLANWLDLFEDLIIRHVPRFNDSVGLDFGCCSGFGSWLLSRLAPRQLYAVDIDDTFIRLAHKWAHHFEITGMTFLANTFRTIPLPTESVDWVFINHVFCNMNPEFFDCSICEVCRVLRPGGTLIFSDGNNPYCPDTIERLQKDFRQYELGNGTPDRPSGQTFLLRRGCIQALAPQLDKETVDLLARNTCYHWGEGLERAVRNYLHNGIVPASPFRPVVDRSPVEPSGEAAGNITDPFWFAARFEEKGISCSIATSSGYCPGGPEEVLEMLREWQGISVIGRKRSPAQLPTGSGSSTVAAEERVVGNRRSRLVEVPIRAARFLKKGLIRLRDKRKG